ncbi:MAG: RNase adapter RapZ [Oscillospiraceae bacterium]|nr:RNase adapter RapZ [Oscillospiraceae bacterium]
MDFFIISGMSGAGKSRAASVLEDMGFYCVDNMPPELIPKFAEMCIAANSRFSHVALVTDIRAGLDFSALFEALDSVKSLDCNYKILYFEASTDVIIKRYKETRRRHPLFVEGTTIEQIIQKESEMLAGVRARADYIIDTSSLTAAALRERLIHFFEDNSLRDQSMIINVSSFGFKYGIPADADLVFDVRFLPNPYYDISLRSKTGLEPDVYNYVMKWQQTTDFLAHLYKLIDFLIPQYIEEGKTSLNIAIGCTGGKHRSVALTEKLGSYISSRGYKTVNLHRDYMR